MILIYDLNFKSRRTTSAAWASFNRFAEMNLFLLLNVATYFFFKFKSVSKKDTSRFGGQTTTT